MTREATGTPTRKELMAARQQVSAWAKEQVRSSGMSRNAVAAALEQAPRWLDARLQRVPTTVFWRHELEALAKVIGVAIPDEIGRAVVLGQGAPASRPRAKPTPAPIEPKTAAEEIEQLLRVAASARPNPARDLRWMLRRFGLGVARPETLEQIAAADGAPRTRVAETEARVLALAADAATRLPLTFLPKACAAIAEGDANGRDQPSLPPTVRNQLGKVTPEAALRFLRAIDPRFAEVSSGSRLVGDTSAAPTRGEEFDATVQQAAQELVRGSCGAATLRSLCAHVQNILERRCAATAVVDSLQRLSGLRRLRLGAEDWFWFERWEPGDLLFRAAVLLQVAGAPVQLTTLHEGLAREAQRRLSIAGAVPVAAPPPADVLQAMLESDPHFAGDAKAGFSSVRPLPLDDVLDPLQLQLLAFFEQHGGVATVGDFSAFAKTAPRRSERLRLMEDAKYCGFLSTLPNDLLVLRGRPLQTAVVNASSERAAKRKSKRAPAWIAGKRWRATILLTPVMRKSRLLSFRIRDMPADVAGSYLQSDGQALVLIQDAHSDRLAGLGEHLKTLIADPTVGSIAFEFDAEARTVAVTPSPP